MSISRYIIVKHGKDSKNQMIAFVVFTFIHVIIVLNVVAIKVLQITGYADDRTLLREVSQYFVLNLLPFFLQLMLYQINILNYRFASMATTPEMGVNLWSCY